MNAIGADLYNHVLTWDVTMTLCCERSDPHHIPCVVIINENIQSDKPERSVSGR